jgi:hypothetical protein
MEKKYTKGMMYSDSELSLIENTFKDNKELTKSLRKVFWAVDLLDADIRQLQKLTPEVFHLLKKTVKPELDIDLPLGQTLDLYMTVDFKEKSLEEMERAVEIRQTLISLIDRGIERLKRLTPIGDNDIVEFQGGNLGKDYIVNLIARNTLIMHIDTCLTSLALLANQAPETPEELKKKAKKNSLR